MKPTTLCGFLLILLPSRMGRADCRGCITFRRGEYGTAARMYRDLVDSHPGTPTCLSRTTDVSELDMGRAVHAFEQSLALRPDAKDAKYNLEEMKLRIQGQATEAEEGERLVLPGDDDTGSGLLASLSKPYLQVGFITSWIATFFVLCVLRLRPELRQITLLNFSWIIFLMVAVCVGGLLLARNEVVEESTYGVVVEKTPARRGPGSDYPVESLISPGVKVKLGGEDGDWRRVYLPGGSDAWVQSARVPEIIR